jgi:hypothetical protein
MEKRKPYKDCLIFLKRYCSLLFTLCQKKKKEKKTRMHINVEQEALTKIENFLMPWVEGLNLAWDHVWLID